MENQKIVYNNTHSHTNKINTYVDLKKDDKDEFDANLSYEMRQINKYNTQSISKKKNDVDSESNLKKFSSTVNAKHSKKNSKVVNNDEPKWEKNESHHEIYGGDDKEGRSYISL